MKGFRPCPKPIKVEKPKYNLRKAMQLKAKNKKLVAKMKTPKQSLGKLKSKLDEVFNEYIRLRDAGLPCICCGKYPTGDNKLQAGHYHSCRYLSTRWDEKNVNGQLMTCNIFNQGNFYGYTKGLIKKYGEGVIELLETKKNNPCKLTAFEVQLLIDEYTNKVKQLKWNMR